MHEATNASYNVCKDWFSRVYRIRTCEQVEETKKELEAKYGAVNINLKTGVWEEIVKEDEAVVPEVVEDEEDCGCEEKKEDCEDCEDKE